MKRSSALTASRRAIEIVVGLESRKGMPLVAQVSRNKRRMSVDRFVKKYLIARLCFPARPCCGKTQGQWFQ
jgi:hypothetical protein